jgi:hypothetical protein
MVRTLTALAALMLVAAAPSAHAATSMDSIFQDDGLLLESGPQSTADGLDEIRGLGATTIHVVVPWAQVAPGREDLARPAGFAADDPAAYPDQGWEKFDRLVREASARGLKVFFTPSSPGPAWAGNCRSSAERKSCVLSLDPAEYGRFVTALGKRYSGTYTPSGAASPLPRVSRWSFVNEPNLGAWLGPQYERSGRRTIATGVKIYRRLAQAGLAAMRATGHGADDLLLGETAPVGGSASTPAKGKNPPRTFLRALFCIDSRGRRIRDAALGCDKFTPFAITGVSHHPYTSGAGAAPYGRIGADDITFTTLSRLTGVLAQAAKAKSIPKSAAGRVVLSEFGYQTNPPDTSVGVPWSKQAEYLNLADFLAYRTPQVRSVAQYLLFDAEDVKSFNTGLVSCRESCGSRRKPAYDAYRLPLYVVTSGRSKMRIFGWTRGATAPQRVEIHLIVKGKDTLLATRTTTAAGFLDVTFTRRSGSYQLRWNDGTTERRSRVAAIALR